MKAAMVFLASAALVCASPLARAADYPSKPVRLMIGFAPGGPSDVMARILTKKMEEILKQPMVSDVARRVDRLCESQSRQDELRLGRQWHAGASGGRVAQARSQDRHH